MIDHDLDSHAFVKAARRLSEELLAPNAERVDRDSAFPQEALRAMADAGFCGMTIPEEYGGHPVSAAVICRVTEELARGCASTAGVLLAFVLGIETLVQVGTPEQKKTYLPDFPLARRSVCFGVTEAHAGSDVAAIRTTAERKGDHWVINGVKALIGNAVGTGSAIAPDLCILAARTSDQPDHKGVSVFVVEATTPGYSISHVYEKMGMRGTTTGEITLKDVTVPAAALLGVEGKGSSYLLQTLDLARLACAAVAIGLSQAALEEAIAYSQRRWTFGAPLAKRQSIQFKIADMATSLHAARLMLYQACRLKDQGLPYNKETSMAKLFASEMADRVTDAAVHIHGGWGLVDRSRVERIYRDARYLRIWEGSSEIQRTIISRSLLQDLPTERVVAAA